MYGGRGTGLDGRFGGKFLVHRNPLCPPLLPVGVDKAEAKGTEQHPTLCVHHHRLLLVHLCVPGGHEGTVIMGVSGDGVCHDWECCSKLCRRPYRTVVVIHMNDLTVTNL